MLQGARGAHTRADADICRKYPRRFHHKRAIVQQPILVAAAVG